MASKRELKKTINYVCSELFAECVANSIYSTKRDEKDTNALLHSIVAMHNNYVCRISHPEPGMPTKKYYADLKEKLNGEISEIIDQITNQA